MSSFVSFRQYYCNCPRCDGADGTPEIRWFSSFLEYAQAALDDMNEYEYGSLFAIGKTEPDFSVGYGGDKRHVFSEVLCYDEREGHKLIARSVDDGHGKLIIQAV